jgi:hypothetical protein
MAMPDQGKVAEIGSFVDFHGLSPSAGFREKGYGLEEMRAATGQPNVACENIDANTGILE